ncbi:Beta-galactosidase 5 [Globisporangium polare]
MEWLALDARLEQKKKAKLRRQQRELKKLQKEREEREKQQRKLHQRCAEMHREELLSIAMELFYKQEAERKRFELKREEDMKIYCDVDKARKRAQELGLSVSTPGISGFERLHELETRIAAKEEALRRASMAKQRLDALPKKRVSLRKMLAAYFTLSLQKKVERAVYDQACDRLLSLFDPESHTSENRGTSLLNYESANGFTPVLATIFCRKLSLLRRMLEIGASPDFETSWGMTPLVAAVMMDDVVAMSILMEFKAAISFETRHGVRALHAAADKGRLELMKVLLRGGANVDATNSNGRAALMQAVLSNHFEAVKILLAFGADKSLKDESGLTAADYASKLKLPHIASLLSSSVSSASLLAQIAEDEDEANEAAGGSFVQRKL